MRRSRRRVHKNAAALTSNVNQNMLSSTVTVSRGLFVVRHAHRGIETPRMPRCP